MAGNERDVLRFAAAHRLVSTDQPISVGGGGAGGAMVAQRLIEARLLSRVRLTPTDPACLVITSVGLAEIGSGLPVPVWEMRGIRRALAAASVWVRAQDGRFEGLTGVVTKREMVAHDLELTGSGGAVVGVARPYGIRVGGVRSAGASGRHHPDVLLQFRDGWAAVEIALGAATPRALGMLLTAYGTNDRFSQVIFLVERERVAREIEEIAVSAGLATVASVQWMEFA